MLEFNNGRLPFAGAQIGHSFRNEIAPRAGLIRCREFQMAEIEHFCDPDISEHPRFHTVADLAVPFYSKENQMSGGQIKPFTIGEAVKNGILCNQTLAYFIGRIFLFATKMGIDPAKMRFRLEWENTFLI